MRLQLVRKRADLLESSHAISLDFAALVASAEDANGDDEHDPEGATVAYERAQLSALLAEARATLISIEAALTKLDGGRFGACERCGNPIAEARLAALPWTPICFGCASAS
jgi:RNA polymerase-binding transcription factor DksA